MKLSKSGLSIGAVGLFLVFKLFNIDCANEEEGECENADYLFR